MVKFHVRSTRLWLGLWFAPLSLLSTLCVSDTHAQEDTTRGPEMQLARFSQQWEEAG